MNMLNNGIFILTMDGVAQMMVITLRAKKSMVVDR